MQFDKKIIVKLVVLFMCLSVISAGIKPAKLDAYVSSDNKNGTFTNPVIFADVPDSDVIRVDNVYYMVSTTMHMSPGVPVMKSYDLVNWETVNYVYDFLETNDACSLKNGKNDYANGSWASSIRYDKYEKRYYVEFSCQSTNKSYFFSTDDIENGAWHRTETVKCYDGSMLFEDTGSSCEKYMFYEDTTSNSDHNMLCMRKMDIDSVTNDVILGEQIVLVEYPNYENPSEGLKAEGCHVYKIGKYYYVFMIQGQSWQRQEIVWRSDSLTPGSFEVKKIFAGNIINEQGKELYANTGIAQGGIVDTVDGNWYAMLFQDYGSVGRMPVLIPMEWDDECWPVLGNDGKSVNEILDKPVEGNITKAIVESDEFNNRSVRHVYNECYSDEIRAGISVDDLADRIENNTILDNEYEYNGSNLSLAWQWNHNPNNNLWSLTDREGYLRLKSGVISKNIQTARNTLTQRTFGPTSSAETSVDISNMREGDVCGLSAFQNQYGFSGVTVENGNKYIIMQRAEKKNDAAGSIIEKIALDADVVYLKVFCDFSVDSAKTSNPKCADKATFYYSLDNIHWEQIGDKLSMSYDWPHFVGYRFGLFYYSTKECGGYVDFDYYHISNDTESEYIPAPTNTPEPVESPKPSENTETPFNSEQQITQTFTSAPTEQPTSTVIPYTSNALKTNSAKYTVKLSGKKTMKIKRGKKIIFKFKVTGTAIKKLTVKVIKGKNVLKITKKNNSVKLVGIKKGKSRITLYAKLKNGKTKKYVRVINVV